MVLWSPQSTGNRFSAGDQFPVQFRTRAHGGDEINLISKGNNYDWPVIHHRDTKDGMMHSLMEFTPSIGPAEALFCTGKAFPLLKGHLLVACMRGQAILNISFQNNRLAGYNFLLKNVYGRIRALAEGPDGFLYIATSQVDPPESRLTPQPNGFDFLLRIKPANFSTGNRTVFTIPADRQTNAIVTVAALTKNKPAGIRPAGELYTQLCAGFHGFKMEGKEKIPSLVDKQWLNGGTAPAIRKSIAQDVIAKGMPAWEGVLSTAEINRMSDYILASKMK